MEKSAPASRPCDHCGNDIPPRRLLALPDTALCVECSQEVGGEFIYRATMQNLGKENSLKKNYGAIQVVRRRRRLPPPK